MTIKEWLAGLRPGDEVIMSSSYYGGIHALKTVKSILEDKTIVLNPYLALCDVMSFTECHRFDGVTGKIIGAPSILRDSWIEEATPKLKADLERKERRSKARFKFEHVSDAIEHAEDPSTIEAAIAALEAILHPVSPPPPQLISRDDLAAAWNEDADHANQWDNLSAEEQLEWAQLRAVARDRARRQGEAD
jgi:hypothetical protein